MYKINEISLIITTLLVFLILLICSSISNVKDSESKIVINEKFYSCITYESSKKIDENHNMAIENARNNKSTDKEWKLEIESINLKANISEGTDKDTLNKYIGHFENTKKDNGNIGLAAHNRGYKVNYFQDIKNLNVGDKIYYYYNGERHVYEVYVNYIILDTDWSVLEDNRDELTLITCVENKDEYRRCVKAYLIN